VGRRWQTVGRACGWQLGAVPVDRAGPPTTGRRLIWCRAAGESARALRCESPPVLRSRTFTARSLRVRSARGIRSRASRTLLLGRSAGAVQASLRPALRATLGQPDFWAPFGRRQAHWTQWNSSPAAAHNGQWNGRSLESLARVSGEWESGKQKWPRFGGPEMSTGPV